MAANATGFHGAPNPALIPSPPSRGAQDAANEFAGAVIALNVVSFLLFGGRLWTRTIPVFRLGADDYLVCAAYLLILVDSILLLLAVPFVFGRSPSSITLADAELANKYAILSEPIWAWSMAAIKISVAAMLLRLEQERFWRRFLWGMIFLQIILVIYNSFALLLQCIPLHAAWDLLNEVPARCWSKDAIRVNLICVSAINIATDFVFALLPITFLRKVRLPLRERVIIGFLMALGVFAASASIVKCAVAVNFGRTSDPAKEGINVGMWSCIEEQVGFIAACIPCLRSPFQKMLSHLGLASTNKGTTYGGGYGQMYGGDIPSVKLRGGREGERRMSDALHGGIKLKSMRSMRSTTDARSDEYILPVGGEAPGRKEIWCTTEVRLEEESRRTSGNRTEGRGFEGRGMGVAGHRSPV
ncbi:hypothetical protein BCR34DRAFT_491415 [Clohesyomyces aquaticus]|uniref:Rhodopsin domain-containing protein n=1 Tax=Clohesyomyces aquaticus TaxID=1231657 RepID=A0A1Y1Z3Y8_9PLEO|nr:hypothetical protein BCR34DRAFT_491415 [Clohesyomyces aquaticus]